MIQAINPSNHADSRTAEILSRYRPIAPKPEPADNNSVASDDGNPSNLPRSISKSPYLRTMWANLQARPTRTRKRGRNAAFGPPPTTKRIRPYTAINTASSSNGIVSYPCPYHYGVSNTYSSPAKSFSMYGFADHRLSNGISLVPLHCGLNDAVSTLTESISVVPSSVRFAENPNGICSYGSLGLDLNLASSSANNNPQELDFIMPRLIEPVKPTVISPRPVRPVGSTVTVKTRVTNDPVCEVCVFDGAEEVEKEAENEEIPVILSDSSNKVRLVNAKYKEMIGQPECCWLDRCVVGVSSSSSLCKRIGGEVTLKLGEDDDGDHAGVSTLEMMTGFTCEVKIEWEIDSKKKCVEASCKAVKVVHREAKDCQFLWRFYDVCDLDVACKV